MSQVDPTIIELMSDSQEITEKVHNLADSIYKEFEILIKNYGENVVKNLMPLVVGILENMDQISREKQQSEVDMELLKDDNEQLLIQFERERRLRRNTEHKYMSCEDSMEEERKDSQTKISSLESIIRMFEIKLKNSQDLVMRMEDRESDTKKEYSKLHERYTDLLKNHMDLRDRTKPISFTEKLENVHNYSINPSQKTSELPTPTSDAITIESTIDMEMSSGGSSLNSSPKILPRNQYSRSLGNEFLALKETKKLLQIDDALRNSLIGDLPKMKNDDDDDNFEEQIKRSFNENNNNDEESPSISDQNADDDLEYKGMRREVENLIMENSELLQTKNALNIVKDDLISRVDELTGERELLTNEVIMLQEVLEKSEQKVQNLENEIKKLKEGDCLKTKDEELEMDMAQRKRFTRIEMARVLMERNQYKERLMELQEAVRFAEMMRANKQHPEKVEKKGALWTFFNGLFGNSTPSNNSHSKKNSSSNVSYTSPRSGNTPPRLTNNDSYIESSGEIRKSSVADETRQQAYGWSLPTKFPNSDGGSNFKPIVPVPVFCRPVEGSKPTDKLVCACGVKMDGGHTKDGGNIIGASIFYNILDPGNAKSPPRNEIERLDRELKESTQEMNSETPSGSCSFVWMCVGDTAIAFDIIIIDASQPSRVIDKFQVSQSNVLCMASLPGASEGDQVIEIDFQMDEKNVNIIECSDEVLPDNVSSVDCLNSSLEYSSKLPTMWIGTQSGILLVHSSITKWNKCLHKVKLKDQILSISYTRDNVIVTLANSTVAIFKRGADGKWVMKKYYEVRLTELNQSVRCSTIVAGKHAWCSLFNRVYIVHIAKPSILDSLDVHPRRESQVRQMVWVGEGVWCSFRMDSTLRLFHAFTHQHLQDVDVEPHVTKLLGHNPIGFSFVRISSLLINSNHLWVGTTNGVILTIPLTETNNTGVLSSQACIGQKPVASGMHKPGSVVRVYTSKDESNIEIKKNLSGIYSPPPGESVRVFNDEKNSDSLSPGSFIPYCNIVGTQLSFHGHRDAVKFIVAMQDSSDKINLPLPSDPLTLKESFSKKYYIMSGGEGYIDFRTGDSETLKNEQSHIIVWQIS